MTVRKRTLSLMAGLMLAGLAQADIYGFVDDQGRTHFSNVPQDKRYTLFLRTDPEPASRAAAKSAKGGARPLANVLARQRAFIAPVARAAAEMSLEAALVHAVVTAESGYNPRARSDKGAMGLMQLMPDTARRYGVANPFDPVQNLRGGAQYLKDLLGRYNNDLRLALAAYNAGEGAVARHGNQIPPYPETRDYVPLVMKLYERYRRAPALAAAGGRKMALAAGGAEAAVD